MVFDNNISKTFSIQSFFCCYLNSLFRLHFEKKIWTEELLGFIDQSKWLVDCFDYDFKCIKMRTLITLTLCLFRLGAADWNIGAKLNQKLSSFMKVPPISR